MATAAPEIPALAARERAFENLYRRYVDDVYRYALALLRNPADAEDVTQTTFLNAYRAVKRGEEISKPQNWLITIAHNAARSRYARAARRVDEVPLEDHLEQLAVPEAERPHVQEVLDALGRLPLNQRAALVMRELEGRTYAEIAHTLGVSVSAVETLIFRGRRSLRVKASEIGVLGLVPAPGWLWHLLDSGGLAAGGAAAGGGAALGGGGAGAAGAGGGALAGSGFVLKAAVAIVAGVVASGINSDLPRPADAARSPSVYGAFVTNAGGGGMGQTIRSVRGDARPTGGAGSGVTASSVFGGGIPGAETTVVGSNGRPVAVAQPAALGAIVVGSAPAGAQAGRPASSSAAVSPSGSPLSGAPLVTTVTQAPAQVASGAVSTVAKTSPVPVPGAPSLPVSVPVPSAPSSVQVPPAPVSVAPLPVQVPPAPVQVPSPHAELPKTPVQLPPAPAPLPLP